MRRVYLFVLLSIGLLFAQSMQVNLQTQFPSPYLSDWTSTPNIIQVVITNPGPAPGTFYIKTELKSDQHGVIFRGDTRPFTILGGGSYTIDNTHLIDINTGTINQNLVQQIRRSNMIPEGIYTLKLELYREGEQTPIDGPTYETVYIMSFDRPELMMPADEEVVLDETSLIFQWSPVVNGIPTFQVRYHLAVFEILPGQVPIRVIQSAYPVFEANVDNATQLIYPASAYGRFKKGKKYIWYVQAFNNNPGINFGQPLGENEGRSEIFSFYYKEKHQPAQNLNTLTRLELVPNVAYLKNLSGTTKTETSTEYILNGNASLVMYVGRDSVVVNVFLNNLTFLKGNLFSPTFTGGSVSASLSGQLSKIRSLANLPIDVTGLHFTPATGLTFQARFRFPGGGVVNPVNLTGTFKLTKTGFTGNLSYSGDWDHPLIKFDHELVKFRMTGIQIDLDNLDARADVRLKYLTSPGLIRIPDIRFSSSQFRIPINISDTDTLNLIPGYDVLKLVTRGINGNVTLNPSNGNIDFDIVFTAGLRFPFVGNPTRIPEVSVRLSKANGFQLTKFVSNLSSNLRLNMRWMQMALRNLKLNSFTYTNGRFNFDLNVDADFSFPDISGFDTPVIRNIHFTQDGITIGAQTFNNPSLSPFQIAGLRLELKKFQVGALNFNWSNGTWPNWNFSADIDVKLPNLPLNYASVLRQQVFHLRNVGLGGNRIQVNFPTLNFTGTEGEIPLGGGAAYYVRTLSGKLDLDWSSGLLVNRSTLNMTGSLKLPDILSCGSVQNLGSSTLQMDGFGHISGTVNNFVPTCPIQLGFVSLRVNSSSLSFEFSGNTQRARMSASVTATMPGISGGTNSTASGNLTVDLITGELLQGSLTFRNFALKIPNNQPILTFHISQATLNKDGLEINGSQQLALGGSTVGVTFNHLLLNLRTMRVVSGDATFQSNFAFRVGLSGGQLSWQAVQVGVASNLTNALQLNLPSNIRITSNGLQISGTSQVQLNYQGIGLQNLRAVFSQNFSLQFQPFQIKSGMVEIYYNTNRIAYLDAGGIHVNLGYFGAQALPERLPLPDVNIAYLVLKQGNTTLVDVTNVSGGVRIATRPGKPVRLVFPALKFNQSTAPEIGVEFSIVVDPLHLQLTSGSIHATIPNNTPGFDLSSLGIPLSIKELDYRDVGGVKTFTFKGVPKLFSTVLSNDILALTLNETGQFDANFNLTLNKSIPLVSGNDMIQLFLSSLRGRIQCSVNSLNFSLTASAALKMRLNNSLQDVVGMDLNVTQAGFNVQNLRVNSNLGNLPLNLGVIDMTLGDFTIPTLTYNQSSGWNFVFDFSANLGFPQFGNFRLPKIEHIRISRSGIHFPQTSFPSLNLTPFQLGGFGLKLTSLRIPEVTVNFFDGSVDFGSASGIRFDLELNMPNLAPNMPPALKNIGLLVSNCGFSHGIITGTIQNKQVADPGIEIPIGGGAKFFAKKFRGRLFGENTSSGWQQRFDVLVEGAFQVPPGLFPCSSPTNISTALHIASTGQISGRIANFLPGCPLKFGPVKLQVNSSSLTFNISGGNQSAIMAMAATLKLPPPTSGDSISVSGNITLDLVSGQFINGQIGINKPFRLNLPMDGDFLSFTINQAVLNKDGLRISGSNTLKLSGGASVTANFNNFLIGLNPFQIKSGNVTFSSSFAFKITLDHGQLKWQATGANPTITEDFGIALNLPPTMGIQDGKFYANGSAQVNFRYQGKDYTGLTVQFKNNFKMNIWPPRVVQGRAEFIRNGELLAYIDNTGFVPGNILAVIPLPDTLGLPNKNIAYMRLKDDQGNLLVETRDTGNAYMLQIKQGKSLKIVIPALKYNGSTPPELTVTSLSIGVNKTTFELVSGGIQIDAPTGNSLFDLTPRGIPLTVTRFAVRKKNGTYGVVIGAKIKLPEALSNMDLVVENLEVSANGISGTVSVGQYHEHYTSGTTYIKTISFGTDVPVQLKVEGIRTNFSNTGFQISFSGDLFVDLFKENNSSSPSPIHFAANVGTNSTSFTTDISHLTNGIPIKIARLLPLANNPSKPPIKFYTNQSDIVLELNTLFKIPSFGENFAVEVKGLKISKSQGLQMPTITFNNPGDMLNFDLFAMKFTISQLGFFYETQGSSKVFGLNLGGKVKVFDNTSTFTGLKIGSDGSFSIAGANLISSPINIVPKRLQLTTLSFEQDSLKATFRVTPPAPLNQSPSDVNFFIAPNGTVGGGGKVVLVNESHAKGGGDQTEWQFWRGTLDLVYMDMDLKLDNFKNSRVNITADLWLDNDRIEFGYKDASGLHPGIQIGFDGSTHFSNYRLQGTPTFNLEVLRFKLTHLSSLSGSDFGIDISGDVSLDVSSVNSTITFKNLQVNSAGDMPNIATAISGGRLSIGNIFLLEINRFKYLPDGGDISFKTGAIPTKKNSGSQKTVTRHVDMYIEFGANMTIANTFSGGVQKFMLFKSSDTTNFVIQNLSLSIQNVVTASFDMVYYSTSTDILFLAAGNVDVNNILHFSTVGLFEQVNGKLRFGIFAMAEIPGPGITLFPGIQLMRVGGGFFYNPKQEYLDLVVQKTDLKGDTIIGSLPSLTGGQAKFAVMLYAGVVIADKSIINGSTMITITDQYINFAGRVVLLNMKDKLVGGFKLTARFDNFYIDGLVYAKIQLGIIQGSGMLQFKIAETDDGTMFYIKGMAHAVVINKSFLEADCRFFVGNPGFMFQAAGQTGFNFWIISVNSRVSGTIWMKWLEPREFGGYFTFQVKADVVLGVVSLTAGVKAILIISDRFVVYGEASGSICLGWGLICWGGSVWLKISNVDPKFSGGFGSDPEMRKKIEEAENMADEMEKEAQKALNNMEAKLAASIRLDDKQVRQGGINLFASNPRRTALSWKSMETENGGLQSSEISTLNSFINQSLTLPSNITSTANYLAQLLSEEEALLQEAENIANQLGQQLDQSLGSLPSVENALEIYDIASPIQALSDSVSVITYTDAEGREHQSFKVKPKLSIDDDLYNQHKERARQMEQKRERILNQIYQRILKLNSYLSQIDVILNREDGTATVKALGEKYLAAREKLEEYFWKNHEYIYELHSWANGALNHLNGLKTSISSFVHNKSNRLSNINELKKLAKARARKLADVVYAGSPDQADNFYQKYSSNIDQLNNINNVRTVCNRLGINLWLDIPRSGLQMLASQFDSAVVANITNHDEKIGAMNAKHEQVTKVIDKIYEKRIGYAQALYDLTDRYLYWQLGSASEDEIEVISTSGLVKLTSYIDQHLLPNYSQSLRYFNITTGGGSSSLLNNSGFMTMGGSGLSGLRFSVATGVANLRQFTSPRPMVRARVGGPDFLTKFHPDVKVIHDRLAQQLNAPQINSINVFLYKDKYRAHILARFDAAHPVGIANYSFAIADAAPAGGSGSSGGSGGTSGGSGSGSGGTTTLGGSTLFGGGSILGGSGSSLLNSGYYNSGLINYTIGLYQSMMPNMGVYSTHFKMIGKKKSFYSYFIPTKLGETSHDFTLKIRARSTSGYVNRRIADFTVHFDGNQNNQFQGTVHMKDDTTPPTVLRVKVPAYQYSTSSILNVHVDAVDYESDVVELAYAVGTSLIPPHPDSVRWKSVGPRTDFNIYNLSLQHNHIYFVYVRAKNSVGMWSSPRASNFVKIDTTAPGAVTVNFTSPYPSDVQSPPSLQNAITNYNSTVTFQQELNGTQFSFVIPISSSGGSSGGTSSGGNDSLTYIFNVIGNFLGYSGYSQNDTIPPGIRVYFDPASDTESGIYQYMFKVTKSPNDPMPNSGWRLLGIDANGHPVTRIKLVGEPLAYMDTFYVHIRAMNKAGLIGPITTTGPIRPLDRTAPTKPGFTYGNIPDYMPYYNGSLTSIVLGLKPAKDYETGVAYYEYKIGSTPGNGDIVSWTRRNVTVYHAPGQVGHVDFPSDLFNPSTGFTLLPPGGVGGGFNFGGPINRIKIDSLSLVSGQKVYVTIRAVNGDGMRSAYVTSREIRIDNTPPSTGILTLQYHSGTHKISVTLSNFSDSESDIYGMKIAIRKNSDPSDTRTITYIIPTTAASPGNSVTLEMPGTYQENTGYTIRFVIANRANLKSPIRQTSFIAGYGGSGATFGGGHNFGGGANFGNPGLPGPGNFPPPGGGINPPGPIGPGH